MDTIYLFYILLLIVSFLYASVGHGGASGYLALMALFGFTASVMKPTALILNLFVSAIAFYQFYKKDHFIWKVFLPLALASIPMAFIGGSIHIDPSLYKKILGGLLLLPIIRFIFFPNAEVAEMKPPNTFLSIIIGAIIGFLSGLIGFGGGIVLSPILLLLKWTNQKQTAAISALFIFVNSLAGLAGQIRTGIEVSTQMWSFVIIAVIGGSLGAYLGAGKFNQTILKNILALVLLVAAGKLIFT